MSPKNKTYRSYTVILILILSLICFCAALYLTFGAYKNYQEASTSLKEETLKLQGKNDIEKIVETNEANIRKVESLFVDENELLLFFDEVKDLSQSVGASSELVSLSNAVKTGLVFKYQATGSFDGVFRFIRLLENMPYYVTVDSVSFKRTIIPNEDGVTTRTVWVANFDLNLISFTGRLDTGNNAN